MAEHLLIIGQIAFVFHAYHAWHELSETVLDDVPRVACSVARLCRTRGINS